MSQFEEDSRIVQDNPNVFDSIYEEWDELREKDCKCVKCRRCRRISKIVKIIGKEIKKLKRKNATKRKYTG